MSPAGEMEGGSVGWIGFVGSPPPAETPSTPVSPAREIDALPDGISFGPRQISIAAMLLVLAAAIIRRRE